MPDQWFYAHGPERLCPFSSTELLALATAGKITPSDTVWKAGIEQGVPAAKVKRLFPEAPAEHPKETTIPDDAPPPRDEATAAPEVSESMGRVEPLGSSLPRLPGAASNPNLKPKKGRATAVRGAVIVSQDGVNVQYIKKCIKCGHNDASKSRMPIKQGTTRVGFYCPKCRKLRPVEIQGIL